MVSNPERIVILVDGGFVTKKLQVPGGPYPTVADVVKLCKTDLLLKPRLQGASIFRVFYYDAPPEGGASKNPLDGSPLDFFTYLHGAHRKALLDGLEMEDDFAVRRGELAFRGWKLGDAALKNMAKAPRLPEGRDFIPEFQQKGVDMKIGLDLAWIALKHIADAIVLIAGDADFVPALKFARKEGLRVYLETLGHSVRRELKAHADVVLG